MTPKKRRWPWVLGSLLIILVLLVWVGKPLVRRVLFWYTHPDHHFAQSPVPPKPDYSKLSSWAAHPQKKEPSDLVPAHVVSRSSHTKRGSSSMSHKLLSVPKHPKADVFFLHPTTYISSKSWNGPITDAHARRRVDNAVMKYQASAFNGCCRVYAPYYRQATLAFARSFLPSGKLAIALAYRDVVRAFRYYIRHWNQGRPFVLAGHSQGTLHGTRLLEEHIVKTPLRKQLVAAYLVGFPVQMDRFQRTLAPLTPCQTPRSTGCVASWLTMGAQATPKRYKDRLRYYPDTKRHEATRTRKILCTHPIRWSSHSAKSLWKQHRGAVRMRIPFKPTKDLGQALPRTVSGHCSQGRFWIQSPKAYGFNILMLGKDDYHVYDYNLFYMDIRYNAMERVKAFLTAKSKTQ